MAKLQVAPELLAQGLFKEVAPGVRIVGASFDHEHGIVELEIEGPGVPDSEHVSAVISVERFSVRFEPVA
jgi:hypothetical protein